MRAFAFKSVDAAFLGTLSCFDLSSGEGDAVVEMEVGDPFFTLATKK